MKKLITIIMLLLASTSWAQRGADAPSVDAGPRPFYEMASDPSVIANIGWVYSKDIATITELFYEDSAGNIVQLTSAGSIYAGSIFWADDISAKWGNTVAAPNVQILWETADANANEAIMVLPEGGTTDVPVFVVGDSTLLNKDLGLFNGVTYPSIAVVDGAATKALYFQHNATNALATVSSGDLLVNIQGANFAPSSNDGAALGIAATGGWSDLYGASGFMMNFGNGDVLFAHVAGLGLSLGGPAISSSGTNDAVFAISQELNDGTGTGTYRGLDVSVTPTNVGGWSTVNLATFRNGTTAVANVGINGTFGQTITAASAHGFDQSITYNGYISAQGINDFSRAGTWIMTDGQTAWDWLLSSSATITESATTPSDYIGFGIDYTNVNVTAGASDTFTYGLRILPVVDQSSYENYVIQSQANINSAGTSYWSVDDEMNMEWIQNNKVPAINIRRSGTPTLLTGTGIADINLNPDVAITRDPVGTGTADYNMVYLDMDNITVGATAGTATNVNALYIKGKAIANVNGTAQAIKVQGDYGSNSWVMGYDASVLQSIATSLSAYSVLHTTNAAMSVPIFNVTRSGAYVGVDAYNDAIYNADLNSTLTDPAFGEMYSMTGYNADLSGVSVVDAAGATSLYGYKFLGSTDADVKEQFAFYASDSTGLGRMGVKFNGTEVGVAVMNNHVTYEDGDSLYMAERGGNITGVPDEIIYDYRSAPNFVITSPNAGEFDYSLVSLDLSTMPAWVQDGTGTVAVNALDIEGHQNVSYENGTLVSIYGVTNKESYNTLNVSGTTTGDINGMATLTSSYTSAGLTTGGNMGTATQSMVTGKGQVTPLTGMDATGTILIANFAGWMDGNTAPAVGPSLATSFGYLTGGTDTGNSNLTYALGMFSGKISWLNIDGYITIDNPFGTAGNGHDLYIFAEDANTAGAGGDLIMHGGAAAGGADKTGYVYIQQPSNTAPQTDDRSFYITQNLTSVAVGGTQTYTMAGGLLTEGNPAGWDYINLLNFTATGVGDFLVDDDANVILTNYSAGNAGAKLEGYQLSASPADNDLVFNIEATGNNSVAAKTEFANIEFRANEVDDAKMAGDITMNFMQDLGTPTLIKGIHMYGAASGVNAGYVTVNEDGENVNFEVFDVDSNAMIYTDADLKTVKIEAGQIASVTTVNAATYDLLTNDYILSVTYTTTGPVTSLTLPTAQCVDGRHIVVKDAGGNAGVNNITIDTEGAEDIDGADTHVINGSYDSVNLYCKTANWFIY